MTNRSPSPISARRVLMLGATGTAGRAAARALVDAEQEVTCLVRPGSKGVLPEGVHRRDGNVTNAEALRGVLSEGAFDAVVSCLASRNGLRRDAWAIDYQAHSNLLKEAKAAGVTHFVLLSALCVQKPKLAFQQAKLAFEGELQASGLTYSIVRPTAFFKSLSGQVARIQAGKPFLVFGDGALTACKPISDQDLGQFIADCLICPERANRILPIGGPGPALTPLDQGRALFDAFGLEPKFRHVPVRLLDTIIGGLRLGGLVSRSLGDKAELAQIGRYYGTEAMLVWDPDAECYDANATPETGSDTLADHYRALARGEASVDLGEHAVF